MNEKDKKTIKKLIFRYLPLLFCLILLSIFIRIVGGVNIYTISIILVIIAMEQFNHHVVMEEYGNKLR